MPFYNMPDGEKLFVREVGQGKPVLILSGLGMSSWQWLPYILPSLKHRQFYIPDYRGFGQSKHCAIPAHNAIESHWQDIKALIPQLNINTVDVIAYSMGATTAMHGLKYGNFEQYIDKYLQIDQTSKFRNSDQDWDFGIYGTQQNKFLTIIQEIYDFLKQQNHYTYLKQLPAVQKQQLSKLWLKFIYLQGNNPIIHRLSQFQLFHTLQPHLLPLQRIDYILWYLHTYLTHDEDYRASLIALKRPAEFIIGQHSALYAAEGQLSVAQQIEHAKVHLMEKSGHAPLMNQPVKFSAALNQFLK